MTTISLPGCRSRPLLGYLKSLGLLAALGDQVHPQTTGWWEHDHFVVGVPTDWTPDDLVEFFARRYAPPPILSPWNSRGGFRTDRQQSSEKRLAELESSDDDRLATYRMAIEVGRLVWQDADELGLLSNGTVANKSKAEFVRLCRARLPDAALPWLDAAVVVLDDDVRYPDLLGGTGGNLGSGDLSSNAHEAALWLVAQSDPSADVRHAILGEPGSQLLKLLPGQFDPGGAGGVNMGPGDRLVNPIDFLLGLHGACLFAAGVARRLDGRKAASVPFTVRPTPGTIRSLADGENIRAELWLPQWERPATVAELRLLLAEGRAQWSGAQSTSSLDFARAAATLGVDRQITRFTRYLVAERHGQANLAVPVGTFDVAARSGVQLTDAIDPFLQAVSRITNPSQAVRTTTNRLRAAIFELVETDGARPARARAVLGRLFDLERAVAQSGAARSTVIRPPQEILAADWAPFLDDGTAEFRVARAVASQRERWAPALGRRATDASTMSVLCRPVSRVGMRRTKTGQAVDDLAWSPHGKVIDLLATDLRHALREGWRERALRCAQHPRSTEQDDAEVLSTPGIDLAFTTSISCPLPDVLAFGAQRLDERLLRRWLTALVMLDWTQAGSFDRSGGSKGTHPLVLATPLDTSFGITAPFFSRHAMSVRALGGEVERSVRFRPSGPHVAAVARGDVGAAVQHGGRRLRQFGVEVPMRPLPVARRQTTAALDAALVPINQADTQRVVAAVRTNLPQASIPKTDQEESP